MLLLTKRLLVVVMLFGIFSCQKENIISNNNISPNQNYPIGQVDNDQQKIQQGQSSTLIEEQITQTLAFKREIVKSHLLVKDVIYFVFNQLLYHPDILGFQGSTSAEVRTGCPCSTPSGDFPDYLLLLEFGAAGAGCTITTNTTTTPPVAMNTAYTGTITGEFEEPLFTATSGEEFTLSLNNFSVNGITLSDVDIEFYYNNDISNPSYDIKILTPIVVTNGIYTTTIPANSGTQRFGKLRNIMDGGVFTDMPDEPGTYIDNIFGFSISDEKIQCENTVTGATQDFCVDTTIDMLLQPTACGCITDGRMRINDDPACTNVTSGNADTIYDFDAFPATGIEGGCDDVVNETEGGGTPTPISMDSC